MWRFPLRDRGKGATMSIWMPCMGLPEVNDHSGALGFALGLHLAHVRHRSQ